MLSRLTFSYQLAFGSHAETSWGEWRAYENRMHLNLGKVSTTSKTHEMAAFSTFLRSLNWKMDGQWKMENGVWLECSAPQQSSPSKNSEKLITDLSSNSRLSE